MNALPTFDFDLQNSSSSVQNVRSPFLVPEQPSSGSFSLWKPSAQGRLPPMNGFFTNPQTEGELQEDILKSPSLFVPQQNSIDSNVNVPSEDQRKSPEFEEETKFFESKDSPNSLMSPNSSPTTIPTNAAKMNKVQISVHNIEDPLETTPLWPNENDHLMGRLQAWAKYISKLSPASQDFLSPQPSPAPSTESPLSDEGKKSLSPGKRSSTSPDSPMLHKIPKLAKETPPPDIQRLPPPSAGKFLWRHYASH